MHDSIRYATLLAAVLAAQVSLPLLLGQEKQETTPEEAQTERMRKMFESLHCPQSDPAAIRAFQGCWKVGAIWGAPRESNLKLGLRASENRFQLWLDSHSAQQAADSTGPRYCELKEGVYSVAPYPDAHLRNLGSYAYYILDIPPKEAEDIARIYFKSHERKMSWEAYRDTFLGFANKGGKYVRTLLVFGPEQVAWDSDGEEDYWILPAPCEGWDDLEERIKKKLKQAEKE